MNSERNEPGNTKLAAADSDRPDVRLREVTREDLPMFYQQQLDPELNRMAAVNPRSAEAFDAHWSKIFDDPGIVVKAILVGDVLAGGISCFRSDGLDSVGYWIAREFWGHGIATQALQLLLERVPIRPLHARVAVTNVASLRVLKKCGFVVTGYVQSPADDRYLACEEAILELRPSTIDGKTPDS